MTEKTSLQPVSTGFPEFDKAFKAVPGQFVVVTGLPGHGKSRWLDQVAVQMSQQSGIKWCLFAPEIGNAEHITDLIEIRVGKPFYKGPTPRMDESTMQSAQDWVNDNFMFIAAKDHTPTIDWILLRAKAAVLRHGVRGLIIDPYNEIEASRGTNQTEAEFVSQLISKCKRFAQAHNVMIFMVVHPQKMRESNACDTIPVPTLYDISRLDHWNDNLDARIVVYRDFDQNRTRLYAENIRREPMCNELGSVDFSFLGTSRRFEEQSNSYKPLSNQA